MTSNTERAVEEQSKFQFYFVALNFTLLAASIQSASLEDYTSLEYSIESAGWACLLFAGFRLLITLENRSKIFSLQGQLDKIKGTIDLTLDQSNELEEIMSDQGKSHSEKYHIGRAFFYIGMTLIVGARIIYGYRIVIN